MLRQICDADDSCTYTCDEEVLGCQVTTLITVDDGSCDYGP